MRWAGLAAAAAAFLFGAVLSADESTPAGLATELTRRQRYLFKDLAKIERAVAGMQEIREMRDAKIYSLTPEERKLERKSRQDFHIFMERFRNDTLEVLEMYDRALKKEDYVDPLRRVFGRALREVVQVKWEEVPMEDVVSELANGYGVRMNVSGELDYRKTMTLSGDMSLQSILLYIENVWNAELVLKNGELWFERAREQAPAPAEEDE